MNTTTQTELELLPVKKDDYFKLDPREIEVEEGFNQREDYGNMDELVESIRANGVLNPVKGYRIRATGEPVRYILTNGHRRLQACLQLINEGVEIRIPFVGGKKPSEVDRLIETIIGNEGKPLNAVEQANVVASLANLGLEPKEIAGKLAVTVATISNMLLLSKARPTLKKKIVSGLISPTLVIKLLRSKNGLTPDSIDEHLERILKESREQAKNNAPETEAPGLRPLSASSGRRNNGSDNRGDSSTGDDADDNTITVTTTTTPAKPEKITEAMINKAEGINPSVAHFTKLLKKVRKEKLDLDRNEELFQTLTSIVEGKLDETEILNLFFN